jgi:CheY-like chemotaxis protein
MDPTGSPSRPIALIINQDADTRQLYSLVLAAAWFEVEEASDGREALAKALSSRHDVIVTETRLPGIDGYQLCGLLRRDPFTRTIPIVVVTGEANPHELDRAERAGASTVLVKPCLPEALLAAIRQAMDTTDVDRSNMLATENAPAAPLPSRRGLTKSRAYARGQTINPPHAPPALVCPTCDEPLVYQHSYIGGVSAAHPEQWDQFECRAGCGTFQYRQRTRQLRRVT